MVSEAVLRPELEGDLVEDFLEVSTFPNAKKCATGFFSHFSERAGIAAVGNRVNDGVTFVNGNHRLARVVLTGCVFSIGDKHDRFPAGFVGKLFFGCEIDGVVKRGPASRNLQTLNCPGQAGQVLCVILCQGYPAVERDYEREISASQEWIRGNWTP